MLPGKQANPQAHSYPCNACGPHTMGDGPLLKFHPGKKALQGAAVTTFGESANQCLTQTKQQRPKLRPGAVRFQQPFNARRARAAARSNANGGASGSSNGPCERGSPAIHVRILPEPALRVRCAAAEPSRGAIPPAPASRHGHPASTGPRSKSQASPIASTRIPPKRLRLPSVPTSTRSLSESRWPQMHHAHICVVAPRRC